MGPLPPCTLFVFLVTVLVLLGGQESEGRTVGDAMTGCESTAAVAGLSTQLVKQLMCPGFHPGLFKSFEGVPNIKFTPGSVFPYLQTPATNGLIHAVEKAGKTLTINSAWRTLPQQFILYERAKTQRCGQTRPAAPPGSSNHNGALALDVNDYSYWQPFLEDAGFKWYGLEDKPHFSWAAGKGGAQDIREASIRAFQLLWNRNHPEDEVTIDGVYGTEVERRLLTAPAEGFPQGATCDPTMIPNDPQLVPEQQASPAQTERRVEGIVDGTPLGGNPYGGQRTTLPSRSGGPGAPYIGSSNPNSPENQLARSMNALYGVYSKAYLLKFTGAAGQELPYATAPHTHLAAGHPFSSYSPSRGIPSYDTPDPFYQPT